MSSIRWGMANGHLGGIWITYDLVPARLASSGDGLIHHIVSHQEIGLELMDTISKQDRSARKGDVRC